MRIASLGLVPAALAPLSPGYFALALAWLVLCSVAMLAEVLFGVRREEIEVRRSLAPRLSAGDREPVDVHVRNFSRRTLRLEVTDTPPVGWNTEGLPRRCLLRPGQEATFTYRTEPSARGRFTFGDLYLRVEHAPGLAIRQWRIGAKEEVRVYPDLREVRRYEVMARRSRLDDLGIHRSRLAGRGTEFERLRDYTPDDEYRQIDWKATARRARPTSRVYEVERSQSVLLVLDAGRMMAGRVGPLAKLDYAVNAALMLAHVALRAGDRIGAMVVADEVEAYLPPGKGPGRFRECLELLYAVEARYCHVDYRGAAEQIARRCKRRSLIVFFTDLLDEDTSAELVGSMHLLLPTHLPLCVTLQDHQVVAAARRPCTTPDELFERMAALELLNERRLALESLHRLGARVLDVPPSELSFAVVNRYLELKARQLL